MHILEYNTTLNTLGNLTQEWKSRKKNAPDYKRVVMTWFYHQQNSHVYGPYSLPNGSQTPDVVSKLVKFNGDQAVVMSNSIMF